MEPVDINKKKHIENNLIPTVDACIVKLAKLRKRHPQKCRIKAREITSNVIQFYNKLAINRDSKMQEQLCGSYHQELSFTEKLIFPDELNVFSKVITTSLAEKRKLEQAYKQSTRNEDIDNNEFKWLHNDSYKLFVFSFSRQPPIFGGKTCHNAHKSFNPDFIVDEC